MQVVFVRETQKKYDIASPLKNKMLLTVLLISNQLSAQTVPYCERL